VRASSSSACRTLRSTWGRFLKVTGDQQSAAQRLDGSPPFQSVDGLLRELAREPEPPPASPAEPSLPAGTRIGRFELLREIGRGGLGIVYEARDTSLGRSVAFKLVRGGARTELRRDRLLREAEAAARLSHPNVVTIHDLGSSEYGPYLVLELLRGENLGERLHRGGIPEREALDIAIEIATGIAHAHEEGVIHGDITPGNVFLCSDGRVKVLDLGLAQLFGSPSSGGGTRGFMAPELRSGAPASMRSDVFGLGVVLFRMVADHMPYRADDDRARPRLRLSGIPAFAEQIERMIAADAADRPADAIEVVAALRAMREQLLRSPAPRPAWTRPQTLLAFSVVVVALVAGGLGLRGRGGSGRPPAGALSIAVLPFVDRSPEHDQHYLAEGIPDQLLTALTRAESVRVIGRTSSFSLGANVTLDAAARSLGVNHLLVGSTRRVGDRLEIAAELHDDGGRTLWSRTYDRSVGDVFSIQDDITYSTLLALGVTPPRAPAPPAPAKHSAEAYSEFLKARQLVNRGAADNVKLARAAYERSIAIDPGYAPAWSGLAIALVVLAETAGPHTSEELRALHDGALKASEKAVALDPKLPDALSARGIILGPIQRDWPRALADLNAAIALDPNNVDALIRYSRVVACFGRYDDAIAAGEKAAARDPLSYRAWGSVGIFYITGGRLADAERSARRALELAPQSLLGQHALGLTLLAQSKPREALAVFERSPERYRLAGTAMAEHSLGHAEASRSALATLEKKYAQSGGTAIAQVYAWRGENTLAFEWLDRAVAAGERDAVSIRVDPILVKLKGDPRYSDMLRKLRLPVD